MKCDCLVEVDDVDMAPGGIETTYVIRYCALHKVAQDLEDENKALRAAYAGAKETIQTQGFTILGLRTDVNNAQQLSRERYKLLDEIGCICIKAMGKGLMWICPVHDSKVKESGLLKPSYEELLEALKACVGWMRPIMDGFNIPPIQKDGTPSARVDCLEKAEKVIAKAEGK